MRTIALYTFLILLFTGISLYGAFYLNDWRGDFWQEVSQRDSSHFWYRIGSFSVAAFVLIYAGAAQTWIQSKLGLVLRDKVSTHYLNLYMQSKDHLANLNPDQRIAEDCNLICTYGINLVSGFIYAALNSVIFLYVIYTIAAPIFPYPILVPLGTIVYALLGVILAGALGYRLVGLSFNKQTAEAQYRRGIVDIRTGVGNDNQHHIRYSTLVGASLRLFNNQKILNLWLGTYNQASVIIPIICIVPLYMAAAVFTFGMLMQIINAIAEAVNSISYLTSNFQQVAEMKACYNRLREFRKHLGD